MSRSSSCSSLTPTAVACTSSQSGSDEPVTTAETSRTALSGLAIYGPGRMSGAVTEMDAPKWLAQGARGSAAQRTNAARKVADYLSDQGFDGHLTDDAAR